MDNRSIKTYQDYEEAIAKGENIIEFVKAAIETYMNSEMYKTAVLADEYDRHKNRTILQYRKFLYTLSGNVVPDNFSSNFKIPSNHFQRFVSQEVQFLLGNGVKWVNEDTADKLGKRFEYQLQKLGRNAIVQAVSYGFWNLNKLEVFEAKQFVPFLDETNGSLRAGIRFWRIDADKPLRAVFYEKDGYTNYIYENGKEGRELAPKRTYIVHTESTPIDGTTIYDGENYPSFPIIPCYANSFKQSEFVGMQEAIDCYDLIKSGFANDVDDASQIYWTLQNAGGMNDADIAAFLQRLKTVHVAQVEDDGVTIDSHTVDVPFAARKEMLDQLERDMYKDYMAFDHSVIANGAVNIPQIKAAYEEINLKCDAFEYCILDFLDNLLAVVGIPDEEPSFTRGMIPNASEEIAAVLEAANYLTPEYITRKVLTLLGDGDQADDMINEMQAADLQTFTGAFGKGKEDKKAETTPAEEIIQEERNEVTE